MANSELEPVSEATLRAPFQYKASDGTWQWHQEFASLSAHGRLGLVQRDGMSWGGVWTGWERFWNRLMRALTKQGTCSGLHRPPRTDIGPAHRWYFCYVLRPAIGAALDALCHAPSCSLARAAASFLHPGNDAGVWAMSPAARAFFLELQHMEPCLDPPSPAGGEVWYRPVPPFDYSNMKVQHALDVMPPAARLYAVCFETGRDGGDCTVWTAAVLVFFAYHITLTLKDIRMEGTFLAKLGFTSQAHKATVQAILLSYGFPDVDPQETVDGEVAYLKGAAGLSKWGSIYEAISQTEDEAPGGKAFELTGTLALVATTSLMVKRGWVAPPHGDRGPLVQLQEVTVAEFSGNVHPFARIGAGLQREECRGLLVGNGCHHIPVIVVHPDHPLAQLNPGIPLRPPQSILTLPQQAPTHQPVDLTTALAASLLTSLSAPLPPWTPDGLETAAVSRLATRGREGRPTYLVIYDGSCMDNGSTDLARPPRAGAGFTILRHTRDQYETLVEGGAWLGKGDHATNNYAEFMACYLGVRALLDRLDNSLEPKPEVLVIGDSQLVTDCLKGRANIGAPHLRAVIAKLVKLTDKKEGTMEGHFFRVDRKYNERTDKLARNAVYRERSFIWLGDDWNKAHEDWLTLGRHQQTTVDNPLRLCPDGQVRPVLTAPPAPTAPAPLLAHDIKWVVDQLNNRMAPPNTETPAPQPQHAPTLDTLKAALVAELTMATLDMPTHMAVGGLLHQWTYNQCTIRSSRRQANPNAPTRIPVDGDDGFHRFWVDVILAVAAAREERARYPPTHGAQHEEEAEAMGGQRSHPRYGNLSWTNPDLSGNPPHLPTQREPAALSQTSQRSASPHGQTRPMVRAGSTSPTLSQPRNSQRPPEYQTAPSRSQASPAPTTKASRGGGQWTPAPRKHRARLPSSPSDDDLLLSSFLSPNPFSPLSQEPTQEHSQQTLSTPKATARPRKTHTQPTNPPPMRRKPPKRARLSTAGPASTKDARLSASAASSPCLQEPSKKASLPSSGGGGRASSTSSTTQQPGPTNGSHRPSTTAEERAPYHHQSSNRPRRTHREEGGQHSPFILVRGARRWLKRRTVLRDLRDCFLVPIPTDTWEYRGPHGQVLLHLPSASTAKSLVETQDRWLSISRRYSFQPYDPSSQDLHDTTRRAWIREMRYVQGTSHLFTNV